jgi:hypothetical protein
VKYTKHFKRGRNIQKSGNLSHSETSVSHLSEYEDQFWDFTSVSLCGFK